MFIDERCGTILFCCSLFDIKMTVSGVEFVNELLATLIIFVKQQYSLYWD